MRIEYRNGNLFDGEDVRFVVHCCNSMGRARSGFVKAVRDTYPDAFLDYEKTYNLDGLRMGQIIPYEAPDGRVIFNLVGQKNYGYDGARYVSYDALTEGFETLDALAPEIGMTELYMPTLGSALAGGSWSIISSIIERHSTNYQPVVYLFDGVLPTT